MRRRTKIGDPTWHDIYSRDAKIEKLRAELIEAKAIVDKVATAVDMENKRLRAIVLPIGRCLIAWRAVCAGHTPAESNSIEASRIAHDAAFAYAQETPKAAQENADG